MYTFTYLNQKNRSLIKIEIFEVNKYNLCIETHTQNKVNGCVCFLPSIASIYLARILCTDCKINTSKFRWLVEKDRNTDLFLFSKTIFKLIVLRFSECQRRNTIPSASTKFWANLNKSEIIWYFIVYRFPIELLLKSSVKILYCLHV